MVLGRAFRHAVVRTLGELTEFLLERGGPVGLVGEKRPEGSLEGLARNFRALLSDARIQMSDTSSKNASSPVRAFQEVGTASRTLA